MTDKINVIDLESTCWRNKNETPENQYSEIIEIGICELDTITGEISKKNGILINVNNSKISEFCTELTTITQDMIDEAGISLNEAFEFIKSEYDINNYWASYGNYDFNMIKSECNDKNIDNPFEDKLKHINVKTEFARMSNLRYKGVGMKKALNMLKIELEGTHHRGIDDAINISKILYTIIKKQNDKIKN